jgi:hypothetical protein
MELFPNEIKKIDRLIEDWLTHPEQELESTFGSKGKVDATTFLDIAKRLQSKGFIPIPQDDRLSIFLVNSPGIKQENNIRLSVQGLGVLQSYCRSDEIKDLPFTAIIKDSTSAEANLDLDEYDMRIKTRREIPLKPEDPSVRQMMYDWNNKKKGFRLIKRWSFEGPGIRIDMSMVSSSPVNSQGQFTGQKKFLEKGSNLFNQAPVYEVEVELLRDEHTTTLESARKHFIRGIGEVLRGIQKNTLLVRKTTKESILADYAKLNGSRKFRGPTPVTLEIDNMRAEAVAGSVNIRSGYNVTDKADGLRCLGFCDEKGELFLLDMGLGVYRTGQASLTCANSLVDGEWVTTDRYDAAINYFLIFDIIKFGGKDVAKLPFADPEDMDNKETRWNKMTEWSTAWTEGKKDVARGITDGTRLQVLRKEFEFGSAADPESIFRACAATLLRAKTHLIYHTDGLILTPNVLDLPNTNTFHEQFKWKPAIDNTIDFLVKFEKDPVNPLSDKITAEVDPVTGEVNRYKTMRLYVGSKKDPAYDDPRATVLNELPLPSKNKTGGVYQPVLFYPTDFPDTMANMAYVPVELDPDSGLEVASTDGTNEPIRHNTIVECRYNPMRAAGWRWIPARIRHDKTERYQKGLKTRDISRTLNAQAVADSVWNSIHDPVTPSMISTGAEFPNKEELAVLQGSETHQRYYQREASEDDLMVIRGLRSFHNHYIKELLLYRPTMLTLDGKGGKKLMDTSCGRAGDIKLWIDVKPAFVLGIDLDGEGIRDPANGAYRRLVNWQMKLGKDKVPPMLFVAANSSQPLVDGEAGTTRDEKNLLRSVFGRSETDGQVPPLLQDKLGGMLRSGTDVAVSMFTFHYMCKDKATFDGFLKNLADTVRVGGYFAGCCTDGDSVFSMLQDTKLGGIRSGMADKTEIWSIRKQYDTEELLADETSLGHAIDVKFISLGADYKREYLVSFDYLVSSMKAIGFELLTEEDLKALPGGLRHSTNLFKNTYASIPDAGKKYPMDAAVKEFSFLSRWFLFKRIGEAPPVEEEEEEEEAVATTEAVAEDKSLKPHKEDAPLMGQVAVEVKEEAKEGEEEEEKEEPIDLFTLPGPERRFEPAEIFMFGPEVALKDTFKIGDDRSTRWLAPYWSFRVIDPEEEGVFYPTLEHYWEAMRLKHGAKKAALAKTLLSTEGSIHQQFLPQYVKKGSESEKAYRERVMDVLVEELEAVKKAVSPANLLSKYGVSFNEADWNAMKPDYIKQGLEQRWTRDKKFREIVEKAKTGGKYLLYYLKQKKLGGGVANDLAGRRKPESGQIEGENLIGKTIMEIAGFRIE